MAFNRPTTASPGDRMFRSVTSLSRSRPDDPEIQPCYAGDYDYSTALGNTAYVTWTDGRVAVGGVQVQNESLTQSRAVDVTFSTHT